jgi:prepilin-type N-terminal cleavage/methylation domain-containing protein
MSEVAQRRLQKRVSAQAGYSLIELMIVTGIMGVVIGIAVVQIGSSKQGLNGDGAMRVVLSQMNQARELAITQRRNMRVTFGGGNLVQIIREEVPGPTLTTISTVVFEGGLQFLTVAGLPDTPEALGNSSAVVFSNATGAATQIKFAPDGTLVDQDGNTLNGTVFVALPSQKLSARAVTIFGSTGRIRGYRWDGMSWKTV